MNSEFLSFFWFVSTQCNLNCEYCITRDYSEELDFHEKPGIELEIADRLIEISKIVKRVKVDIGGIKEPLFLKNLDTVISKLKSVPNIELSLTTNFSNIRSIENSITHLDKILVSIHIKERTEPEIDQLISDIGLRPIYLGDLDTVDLVDNLTRLWFQLVFTQKRSRRLALKLVEE